MPSEDAETLKDIFFRWARGAGYGADFARQFAHEVLLELSRECGGRYLYISIGAKTRRNQRDQRIRASFRNLLTRMSPSAAVLSLSRREHLSARQIWRICKGIALPAASQTAGAP